MDECLFVFFLLEDDMISGRCQLQLSSLAHSAAAYTLQNTTTATRKPAPCPLIKNNPNVGGRKAAGKFKNKRRRAHSSIIWGLRTLLAHEVRESTSAYGRNKPRLQPRTRLDGWNGKGHRNTPKKVVLKRYALQFYMEGLAALHRRYGSGNVRPT